MFRLIILFFFFPFFSLGADRNISIELAFEKLEKFQSEEIPANFDSTIFKSMALLFDEAIDKGKRPLVYLSEKISVNMLLTNLQHMTLPPLGKMGVEVDEFLAQVEDSLDLLDMGEWTQLSKNPDLTEMNELNQLLAIATSWDLLRKKSNGGRVATKINQHFDGLIKNPDKSIHLHTNFLESHGRYDDGLKKFFLRLK